MNGQSAPKELARRVVGLAMKVHRKLGPGFVEVVYQNALILELRRAHFSVECQHPLKVKYEDTVVGEFTADLLVDNTLLIELKAARAIDPAHETQLMNYLHATGLETGLLLNFGGPSLQFHTKSRQYRKPSEMPNPNLLP
jgi:GxxExxY protein